LEDSGLRYWGADNFFTGGTTYSITSVPIANTLDDTVYQSIRLGTFSYSIPVPVGNYEVDIHLAELYVFVVIVEIQTGNDVNCQVVYCTYIPMKKKPY
jgi:Malectin domain